MVEILKIAGIYMGIIIGAGFASGQEILSFFTVYGEKWIFGMVFSGLIFSIVGGATVKIIYDNNIKSSEIFFRKISGTFFGKVFDLISAVFTVVLFMAMYSASGGFMEEGLGLCRIYGSIILFILCFIVFCFGSSGVGVVNGILSPIILFLSIIVCIYIFISKDKMVFMYGIMENSDYKWLFSALVYSSYNIITGIASLTSSNDIIMKNEKTFFGGILGGMGMGVIGIFTGAVLFIYSDIALGVELPLLSILKNSENYIKAMYFVVIWCAIISTALGNGYAFVERMSNKLSINRCVLSFFLSLFGIIFTYADFSVVVGSLYSYFGVIGIFMIIFVIIYTLKNY